MNWRPMATPSLISVAGMGRTMNLEPSVPFRHGSHSLGPSLEKLKNVKLGDRTTVKGILEPILANETLFGTDLTKTPLAAKITAIFEDLVADASAVEAVLQKYLN